MEQTQRATIPNTLKELYAYMTDNHIYFYQTDHKAINGKRTLITPIVFEQLLNNPHEPFKS